jgi:Ca2+-binding EF-hand superfamily protein
MRKTWLRGAALMGLGFVAFSPLSGAGDTGPGPIKSLEDLQDSGRMLFKVADENNDGQISQKEAADAANLLVGGFFFRADANGDGVLSKEEATAARDSFLSMHPLIRVVFEKNKNVVPTTAGTPAGNAELVWQTFVDTNHDGNLQAGEVRQAVQTTVNATFATADTNRDGQLSPTEVNAAVIGAANAMGQVAFQAADVDHNGQLSTAEFDKAIIEPAHALFRAIDLNNDGQISQQEAQTARQAIIAQVKGLRVAEPANSARNILRSGADPAQVSPVPRFNVPATPAPATTPPGQ